MLTIFTIPKPFRGHIAVIQRNAIKSWTLLQPSPEIILFGDDEGTREVAEEFGVRHIADVAHNEYGTPLVNDLFEKAERLATHNLLCYVNADIILMSDFMQAVERIARRKRWFLMAGQRWDVELKESLHFDPQWEELLRAYATRNGQLYPPTGIDYFVFPRGLWGEIPPFAVGRTIWDNWLLYRARSQKALCIDATQVIMAVHQNHDYSHGAKGKQSIWEGPEARLNLQLAGGRRCIFTLQDATHLLTAKGLKKALGLLRWQRHLETTAILYPYLRLPIWLIRKAVIIVNRLLSRLRFKTNNGGSV